LSVHAEKAVDVVEYGRYPPLQPREFLAELPDDHAAPVQRLDGIRRSHDPEVLVRVVARAAGVGEVVNLPRRGTAEVQQCYPAASEAPSALAESAGPACVA